jgi:hypothetical protein
MANQFPFSRDAAGVGRHGESGVDNEEKKQDKAVQCEVNNSTLSH